MLPVAGVQAATRFRGDPEVALQTQAGLLALRARPGLLPRDGGPIVRGRALLPEWLVAALAAARRLVVDRTPR